MEVYCLSAIFSLKININNDLMQIFIIQPNSKTLVYQCTITTTVEDILEFIYNKTGLSESFYYLVTMGKPIYKYLFEDTQKNLAELNITNNQTIYIYARVCHQTCRKKLNSTA